MQPRLMLPQEAVLPQEAALPPEAALSQKTVLPMKQKKTNAPNVATLTKTKTITSQTMTSQTMTIEDANASNESWSPLDSLTLSLR